MRARLLQQAAERMALEFNKPPVELRATDCPKIKTDPGLLERDCVGCSERERCSMRANTVADRCAPIMPRVNYIGHLFSLNKVLRFGVADLLACEIRDLCMFQAILGDVEAIVSAERQKLLSSNSVIPNAGR